MLQEALSQEDLTQSEFSAVLDSLQNVARDTNVKVVRCISKLRYVAVVCILLFVSHYSAGCAVGAPAFVVSHIWHQPLTM